jgi:hypothetical protein
MRWGSMGVGPRLHGAGLGLGLCLGLVERADCDGYGDDGAGDGDVGGARVSSSGIAIQDGPGGGEGVLEGGELVEERELADLAGEGVELADEPGLVVEGAVGLGAVAGAEVVAAFGDAAAFAAGFVDVLALGNHGSSSGR